MTLGNIMSVLSGKGAFSSQESSERAEDAAELLGHISYQAAWAWNAFAALIGPDGNEIPPWIRTAIELGLPTETATELVKSLSVSRSGAVILSERLSPNWGEGQYQLSDLEEASLRTLGMSLEDVNSITSAV